MPTHVRASRVPFLVRRGRQLLRVGALLALGAVGAPAMAAVIYTYTGKPFEVASGIFTTADKLVFSFTLNAALAPSQLGVNLSPLSWQVSAGTWSLDSSTPGALLGAAQVSTDAQGLVRVACFSGGSSAGGFNLQAGPTVGDFLVMTSCSIPQAGPLEAVVAGTAGTASSDFNSGTWTLAPVVVPDPDPNPNPNGVPAPGALALAALALLVAGAQRHRTPARA